MSRRVGTIVGLALVLSPLAFQAEPASALTRTYTQETRRYNYRRKDRVRTVQDQTIFQNDQRRTDVNLIGVAISSYQREHEGNLPPRFPQTYTEICRPDAKSCGRLYNLTQYVRAYLHAMPVDPAAPAGGNGTGYEVVQEDWRQRFGVRNAGKYGGGVNIVIHR